MYGPHRKLSASAILTVQHGSAVVEDDKRVEIAFGFWNKGGYSNEKKKQKP